MGIFYQPPPPVVSNTGAQPYAPNKLPPAITAVPVNSPTPNEDQLGNLIAILSAWNPPPGSVHNFIHRAKQPYDYAKLSPGIPGVSVDNPTPNEDAAVNFNVVRSIWDAATFNNNPILPTMQMGKPGWSVDNPPRFRQPIIYSDTPPNLPQTLVLQPQGFTAAVTVQGPYTNQWLVTVLGSWQPSDPLPTLSIRSAGMPGWSVDNPPTFVRQQFPYVAAPQTLPQTLVLQPQSFTPAVFQNPYTNQWLSTVLVSWQPFIPIPTLNNKLPPQITAVPVNNPPFSSRTQLPNILAQWQPPPPLPTPSIRINIIQGGTAPPTVSVYEWLTRYRRRRR